MKNLILLLITITYFSQITKAQPGSPRISMGETPGISLSNSELKGPIKEIVESEYYKQPREDKIDTLKVIIKTVMKFDQKGNETEELKYGRTGKLLSRCIYNHTNPKSIVVRKFIQDTLLLGKYIFTCDDDGKLLEMSLFPEKYNMALFRMVYKYNNKGCNDTILSYTGKYTSNIKVIEYNNKNQKMRDKSYDFRGILTQSSSISYDDKGDITEKGYLDAPLIQVNSIIKRTKMDEHGNWKLFTLEDDGFSDNIELKKIVKRVILYY